MKKKKSLLIFIALISFLILACSMIYDTTINEDGSGVFSLKVHFNEEELELILPMTDTFDMGIETPQDICNVLTEELELGYKADLNVLTDETNYTCVISFNFYNLEELEEIYSQFDVYVYDLEFTEDGHLIYDVDFNLGDEIDDSIQEYELDLDVEYIWQVTAPFNIVEHNADSISGNTVSVDIGAVGYSNLYFQTGFGASFELYTDSTLEFLTEIGEDETGIFQLGFIFDADQEEDLLDFLEDLDIGDEPEDWCDEIEDWLESIEAFPSGMDNDFVQEEAGEGFACKNTFEFDDLDELDDLYKEFGFIDPDTLRIRDNSLEYEVIADLALASELGLDDLEADMEILWTVLSPWQVVEHDADDEIDNLISWEMRDGDDLEVIFTAEKSNFLFFLIAGAALFGFVVIVGVFFIFRASKKKTAAE